MVYINWCQSVDTTSCEVGYLGNQQPHEVNEHGDLIHRHSNATWIDVSHNREATPIDLGTTTDKRTALDGWLQTEATRNPGCSATLVYDSTSVVQAYGQDATSTFELIAGRYRETERIVLEDDEDRGVNSVIEDVKWSEPLALPTDAQVDAATTRPDWSNENGLGDVPWGDLERKNS
jgi:hypothetical protein